MSIEFMVLRERGGIDRLRKFDAASFVGFYIQDFQSLQTAFPLRQNQMVGKSIDCFDLYCRAVRDKLFPVLLAWI